MRRLIAFEDETKRLTQCSPAVKSRVRNERRFSQSGATPYSSPPILFYFLVYPQLSNYVNALPYPPKCLSIVDHDHNSSDTNCSE